MSLIQRDATPDLWYNQFEQLLRRVADIETAMLTISAANSAYVRNGRNMMFDGWATDSSTASETAVTLDRWGQAAVRFQPLIFDVDASIVQVSVVVDGAYSAGSLTVHVYIDGVDTGLTVAIDGEHTAVARETAAYGKVVALAGEKITLRYTTDAAWIPVTIQNVFILISEL